MEVLQEGRYYQLTFMVAGECARREDGAASTGIQCKPLRETSGCPRHRVFQKEQDG